MALVVAAFWGVDWAVVILTCMLALVEICLKTSPIKTVKVTITHSANIIFFMYNLGDSGT